MNFIIILVTSLIVFAIFRLFFIGLFWVLNKIFKTPENSIKFDLGLSIGFYLMYIQGFLGAVQGVSDNNKLSNVEWYFVLTFIGIISILWCYFSWEFKFKAKPQFAKYNIQMIIKKIIVFSLVMIFVLWQGYIQLDKKFGGNSNEEKEMLMSLASTTIVSGIIAFDRVLNQISNYFKEKNK